MSLSFRLISILVGILLLRATLVYGQLVVSSTTAKSNDTTANKIKCYQCPGILAEKPQLGMIACPQVFPPGGKDIPHVNGRKFAIQPEWVCIQCTMYCVISRHFIPQLQPEVQKSGA